MPPTQQQSAILEFIQEFRDREGVAPSQREIQAHFGFASRNAARKHVDALTRKGLLERPAGRARSLIPVNAASPLIRIPILGEIPAGRPVDQEQQSDRCISIDPDTIHLPRSSRIFALQVKGDSMIGAGILDGDITIMEFREPSHHDIVAALIDGETTLKRYLVQRGKPFLRAENPNYPDLIPARELVIQGVLHTLVRVMTRRV